MSQLRVRPAEPPDLPAIYPQAIRTNTATFDVSEPSLSF
jgi:hypothetical protein